MKSKALFPVLIYHQPLFSGKPRIRLQLFLKSLIHEISVLKSEDSAGRNWSQLNYKNGYTSYGSRDRLYEFSPTFLELKKAIDTHTQIFLRELEYEVSKTSLLMNTQWVNVMGKGTYHTMHFHPHSVLSGTFYVRTPRPLSPLKFEDPKLGLLMNSPMKKKSAEQQCFYTIAPKAGDLVLFESWLRHEVPENQSQQERISISFNYDWSPHVSG
jgi:uncharacterized protein (TIGR02466 family)